MIEAQRAFSYVVKSDTGFAPNPFHGWCTLACCKPSIRRHAAPGDLIVGLSTRSERIVYVMRVAERLTFGEYWHDRRFARKRPRWAATRIRERCGDNIYRPLESGGFEQQVSAHWDHEHDRPHEGNLAHDTRTDAVLAAKEFVYFGGEGPALPEYLAFLKVGRAHRSRFTELELQEIERLFATLPRGIQDRPSLWSKTDSSWRPGCA